jgi:hypothetical protein
MTSMSRALLAAVLVASVALAAAPPRRPAGIGSVKEDEPCPAPRDTAGPDVAFQRALVWAFEPAPLEIRTQAIEDLGLLGDPRALNPLAQLSLDPNQAIARAAVRAVGTIRHPRAEEILSNVVRHPSIADVVKLEALKLVPFQNTFTALRFVHQVARQRVQVSPAVSASARTLAASFPEPTAEQATPAFAPAPEAPPPGAMTPLAFPGEAK